jgi:transcriptional regulator
LAHVARANPVWRQARQDVDVLVVFQGPQAYISPNWYPSKAQTHREVPTWNYVTVQARGRLQVRDDPVWLRGLLSRLTAVHEADQPVPWSLADAPADAIDRMLRAVVGIEIELTALQGKWKVSQNKPAADRAGVVQGLGQRAGDAAAAMAAQVSSPGA